MCHQTSRLVPPLQGTEDLAFGGRSGARVPRYARRSMEVLVVAAWAPELERFRSLSAGGDRGPGPSARLGKFSSARTAVVGVGLVEASAGMASLLSEVAGLKPAAVVLIGTCGALPGSGLPVGEVVSVARGRVVDAGVLSGRAELPSPMPAVVDADGTLLSRFAPWLPTPAARGLTALTTLGITTDDTLAAELAPHGAIEHLEVFAVARACACAGVPWCALLGVANPVGAAGRAAWRANHVRASARAAEVAHAALLGAA